MSWIFFISSTRNAGHSKGGKEIVAPLQEMSAEQIFFMGHSSGYHPASVRGSCFQQLCRSPKSGGQYINFTGEEL